MADLSEADYGVCYYRSKDFFNNLKIRIKLRKSTSNGPSLIEMQSKGGNKLSANQGQSKSSNQINDYEEIIIGWQQKIFSQEEIRKYSEEIKPDDSPIVKTYHTEVARLKKNPKYKPGRIFTYVDHDEYLNEPMKHTVQNVENISYVAAKSASIRRRKAVKRETESSSTMAPRFNLIIEKPTEEQQVERHLVFPPVKVMYIMADLSSKENQPDVANDENSTDSTQSNVNHKVLCTLQLDSQGVLIMQPDFNGLRKPYHQKGPHLKDHFEYIIEHASKEVTWYAAAHNEKLVSEVESRHRDMMQLLVGTEFEMPIASASSISQSRPLRVLCFGQIESAFDFSYNNLYIHYFINLPPNWRIQPNCKLAGTTQISSTREADQGTFDILVLDKIAHFGHPFEYEMFYEHPMGDSKLNSSNNDIQWPSLIYEVLSLDNWSRYRVEGYGYVDLPRKAGFHRITSSTWRPVGNSVFNEMRRFFIGGCPELLDSSFVGLPNDLNLKHSDERQLSKCGVRTESSGSVTIQFNVVRQQRPNVNDDVRLTGLANSSMTPTSIRQQQRKQKLLQGASYVHNNVIEVINAFQRAREELILVRELATGMKDLSADDALLNDEDDEDDKEFVRQALVRQMQT